VQWVLKILNKKLAEERKWLQTENLGAMDPKYRHGARMARERIPQLEQAIEVLKKTTPPPPKKKPLVTTNPGRVPGQFSLFDILKSK